MGEGIMGHLSKGVVLTKLDAAINHTNAAGAFDRRTQFLTDLRAANDPPKYCTLLQQFAHVSVAQANYLGAKWYQPGGWWPNPTEAFAVVHQGLIKALELAIQFNMRLDSYWLPASPPGVIEVLIAKSVCQITRIILTPPTNERATIPRPALRDMWLVKPRTGNPPPLEDIHDEVVETMDEKTITWRVRDLPETAS